MGFSRQEYWSGLPFPPLEDLPNPGIKLGSPALQADSLLSEPILKECITVNKTKQNKTKLPTFPESPETQVFRPFCVYAVMLEVVNGIRKD